MSIQNEIERINGNVQNSIEKIRQTGVSVPEKANSDTLPSLVDALANEKQDKSNAVSVTGGAEITMGESIGAGPYDIEMKEGSITVNGKKVAADGLPGKSAYQSAQEGGYTGTESDFNTDLAEVSSKQRVVDLGSIEDWTSNGEDSYVLQTEMAEELFAVRDNPIVIVGDLMGPGSQTSLYSVAMQQPAGYFLSAVYHDIELKFFITTRGAVMFKTVGLLTEQGGKMTGPLTLHADPTEPLEAATKQYVDNQVGAINTVLDEINGEVV